MERFYLLQVLGTFLEVSAYSLDELRRKATVLKNKNGLSGKPYRVFVGTRPAGSAECFKFGTYAKQDVFA